MLAAGMPPKWLARSIAISTSGITRLCWRIARHQPERPSRDRSKAGKPLSSTLYYIVTLTFSPRGASILASNHIATPNSHHLDRCRHWCNRTDTRPPDPWAFGHESCGPDACGKHTIRSGEARRDDPHHPRGWHPGRSALWWHLLAGIARRAFPV